MTRLDRYFLREALPIFGFGLVLYVVLGILTNVLPRAQYLGAASGWKVLEWMLLFIPAAVSLALPTAMLLAVLLTYGRFSRENELLVIQAGGISVLRTARTFLIGGLILSGVSLGLAEWVIPWANRTSVLMYWNVLVPERNALFRLAGQDLAVGPYRLYFAHYDPTAQAVVGVRLERWQDQTLTVILARSARFEGHRLVFKDYRVFTLDLAQLPLPDFNRLDEAQAYLQGFIKAQNLGPPGAELSIQLSRSQQDLEAQYAGGGFESSIPLSSWWHKLQAPAASPKEWLEARAQWHTGVALAFANLAVLFLALPVAVRRGISPGGALASALILTILYYVVFTIGKTLALTGVIAPEIAAWMANALALGLGWGLGKGLYR
ncbi:hypothetical protein MGR01S_11520 [Meiothermus granaticius NBRC 107808]|uniref:LPS export ABC transporter permease LptG n=2 Tax=Meiothermus TaxID=65551 RepID=A0A399F8L1_9DEIN|nr:LPS export ABC transporter permease LptG [Meiothermus granaticius NBRC 107808]GEM86527.1 hypothetical protein MGR01S_11520 [Meiothermus granaticius NBRC 107808]